MTLPMLRSELLLGAVAFFLIGVVLGYGLRTQQLRRFVEVYGACAVAEVYRP